MDVVGDKGNNSGPIKLIANVLNCLGDAWVARKVVVMAGVKGIQLGVLLVGDIE